MTLRAILAAVAVVALANNPARAAQHSEAIELVRRECSACHGPRGISVAPTFPHLAGQQAEYLEVQLKAFRDRSRADPYAQAFMWGMAAELSDGTIAEIAAYYAAQPRAPGETARPADVDAGRKIYERGIPAQQIPPLSGLPHATRQRGWRHPPPRWPAQSVPREAAEVLRRRSSC